MPTETNGLNLIPATIVTAGPSARPVERLIGLQSAIARTIGWLVALRLPRLHPALFPLHPSRRGDLP